MIIEIDIEAARDESQHHWLDRLLETVEDGWHVLRVDNPESFAATSWMGNRGRAGRRVKSLLEASAKPGAWGGPHNRRVRVAAAPTTEDELSPEQAARFAREQLVVLVENRVSDGAFLNRVVVELGKSLNTWWNRGTSPVRIDSLGGKGQIEQEVRVRGEVSPRPRFVVVIDSDKRGPDDDPSKDARSVQKRCKEYGFPCWLLTKRESENYLPGELLEQRPNAGTEHQRRLDVWARLEDDQKDFYDMKSGLSKEPSTSEQKLFECLPESDREVLSTGFGDKVYECWAVYRDRVRVARGLQDRGRGDLERGLQLIRMEV